jgi:DNA-binding MurR/RpiR family transcriptional regulator
METSMKKVNELHKKIADYILRHPEKTYEEIGKVAGLSLAQISVIARKHGIDRSRTRMLTPELARILEG